MDIMIEKEDQGVGESDCRHWMVLLAEINSHVEATRQVGGEPDCIHWLEIVEESDVMIVKQSDQSLKTVSIATCKIRRKVID